MAPGLMLARSWERRLDPAGWWFSEKLDGVRGYWTGKSLVSRGGHTVWAPDWFVAGLPDTPLDGELFAGRGNFRQTTGIVRSQGKSRDWLKVSFVVFDAPTVDAGFEGRIDAVRALLSSGPSHVIAHTHEVCADRDHLTGELARVEALGGEGLMIRKPGSRYEAGRSRALLKVKTATAL